MTDAQQMSGQARERMHAEAVAITADLVSIDFADSHSLVSRSWTVGTGSGCAGVGRLRLSSSCALCL